MEKNYQERLENVLKRVRKKDDLYDMFGNPDEIILNPKNKLEKEYGEAFISYAEDYLELDMSIEYDELTYNHIEESLYVEYIVNTINAYNMTKSEEQVKRVIEDYSDPEDLAVINYEEKIIMDTMGEDAWQVILDCCGYDPRNSDDIEEFKKAYEVVTKVADETYNDLDIVDFINEAACFHQLHNSVMIGEYYVYKKIYFN